MPSCRGGMSVWRSSVCVSSHAGCRARMPWRARVGHRVAMAATFNAGRAASAPAPSRIGRVPRAGAGLRSGGCCRSSWGYRRWGLVGVAHRRGEDRAQQRFALVEEQLRVIGRRVHLAAVAGDGAAEGPVQVQGGAHRDAKSAATAKNCSSTDAARGASSGSVAGAQIFTGISCMVGSRAQSDMRRILKPARLLRGSSLAVGGRGPSAVGEVL